MFNDFVWKNYLSAGGQAVAKIFERNLCEKFTKEYIEQIVSVHQIYCPDKGTSYYIEEQLVDLRQVLQDGGYILEPGEYTFDLAMDSLYQYLKEEEGFDDQTIFSYLSDNLEYCTTFFAIDLPELFVPYYFRCNYNLLEKIAQEFEIALPPIPLKKNYKERFYYYGDICASLLEFREKHNMSPYELCAFLYDFAPKFLGGIDSYIIRDLPEPKSAFFIGGSKNDADLRDEPDCITAWQCSPDTRAGDMIVMYLRTPISAIDSIWRSVSVGFNDPFFYYYRCTYIANPVGISRITQKQLQKDKVFKDLPIVRKNMQGINGVELMPSEYNHLVELSGAETPKLEYIASDHDLTFTREKDVENKLIQPLLKKLDYCEGDYEQQLYVEIGNHNHALIPDFVLLPIKEKGHQSAFAIIEAKLSIPNLAELKEVKMQARSYARLLNVKYAVIASKEKLWVMEPGDDFNFDNEIFAAAWGELNDADVFVRLYKLIGNRYGT